MKKFLGMCLAFAMAFTLAACGGNTDTDEGGKKVYNVGVAFYDYNDNFMTLYREELEEYFASKNTDTVEYKISMVDGKNDMAEQTSQIRNFITQGMDLIICNLVQTSSADAIIDEVVESEIPLILINREPLAYGENGEVLKEAYEGILNNPTVAYVGADARQSGTYQGELLLATENKGDINGDGVVSYVMIQGDPENIDAQFRTEFSIKALTDAGVKVEELVNQVGNWQQDQGQTIAANALAAHGDKIDVIFCNNDGMALGAYAAITAASRTVGKDIYLLGVDALPECVEMVAKGTMTGTVKNDHVAQSHAAVDAAVEALNGGELQNYYWANYAKVDQEYAKGQ